MWPARSRFCLRIWTLALCHASEEPNLHLELYLRDVTDGMRSRKLPVDGCDENCERIQPVIGLGLHSSAVEDVDHERCGWRSERGSPVRNARVFWCLIATSTLKGSFCRLQHIHVHVEEEEWEVIHRLVIDGCCLDLFSEIEVCKMNVRSEF